MKKFDDIYEIVHSECEQDLERTRNRTIVNTIVILGIIIIIICFLIKIQLYGFIIPVAIVAIFLFSKIIKNNRNYQKLFREKVIKRFVEEYSSNLKYEPSRGGFPGSYSRGEFEKFDNFESENLIKGLLNEYCRINMSEVRTKKIYTDENDNKYYKTLFHGLFIEADFKKFVNAKIKIRKDFTILYENKDKLEMDSGEFEKIFDVYADNKIIAMQLLTADVMQLLIDFKQDNKLIPEITIKGNELYIRMETGDIFDANLLKKSFDYNMLLKYYNIINFSLNLTEKIVKNIRETEL